MNHNQSLDQKNKNKNKNEKKKERNSNTNKKQDQKLPKRLQPSSFTSTNESGGDAVDSEG